MAVKEFVTAYGFWERSGTHNPVLLNAVSDVLWQLTE